VVSYIPGVRSPGIHWGLGGPQRRSSEENNVPLLALPGNEPRSTSQQSIRYID